MFKRILVAVDGSPPANRGLRVALALAKERHATLYVAHVIEDAAVRRGFDGGVYIPAQYADSLVAGLRDAGRRILAKAGKTALQAH